MAEYAAPYRVCDGAVGNIDRCIAVNIAVGKGEGARGTCTPEDIDNRPVCNIYHAIVIGITK